jgi:hypothetical protein
MQNGVRYLLLAPLFAGLICYSEAGWAQSAKGQSPEFLVAECGPFLVGHRIGSELGVDRGRGKAINEKDSSLSSMTFIHALGSSKVLIRFSRPDQGPAIPAVNEETEATVIVSDSKKLAFVEAERAGVFMYTIFLRSQTASWSKHVAFLDDVSSLFVADCRIRLQ